MFRVHSIYLEEKFISQKQMVLTDFNKKVCLQAKQNSD